MIKIILIFLCFLQFTKRNPNAPIGEGSWIVKDLIKKHLQHRCEYRHKKIVKGKEKEKENIECKRYSNL